MTTISFEPFFRWSNCQQQGQDDDLVPPPEFISGDHDSQVFSEAIITSTQVDDAANLNSFEASQSPVPKKIRLHKEKYTIQEAMQVMKKLGNHAEAAEALLESLANRTFTNVTGDDLDELNRKQSALQTRLWKLNKKMKDRKFQHQVSKDPTILNATFAAKEDFSFLNRLKPHDESFSGSDESSLVFSQPEVSQPTEKEKIFRRKLSELKDWKYIMERSKKSFDSVKEEAEKQVLFFIF
jgi:hypothetical protein